MAQRSIMLTDYRRDGGLFQRRSSWVVVVVAVVGLLLVPAIFGDRYLFGHYFSNSEILGFGLPQINSALIAVVGAIALNVLVGFTGLVSLGHAAFLAVGACTAALAGTEWGWPLIPVLLLAGVVGILVGVVVGLPSLRLRGLYLMLATLALHFIMLYIFLRFQLKFFTPAGLPFNTASIGSFAVDTEKKWYWTLIVVLGLVLLGLRNLMKSRHGRSFIAARDHDIAASSLGMNVPRVRLASFAVSSFIVSVIGALYAYYLGHLSDTSFSLTLVIGYFAMVIIGGIGSTGGAVLGALLWTLLPQVLTFATTDVDPTTPVIGNMLTTYQGQTVSVVMGILIILILRFRPEGLISYWKAVVHACRRWPYSP